MKGSELKYLEIYVGAFVFGTQNLKSPGLKVARSTYSAIVSR
jgi:hypothetical protein